MTPMKRKRFLKAGRLLALSLAVLVAASVYLVNIQGPLLQRHNALVGADGVGDTTKIVYFQIRPHAADPGATYASNVSNATAYEYAPTVAANASATGSTPFGTAFDIVVGVAVDYDDGYNQTSSEWDNSYNWCTLTCADLSIGANTNMTEVLVGSNANTAWYNYYLNNGGSGYTIVLGETFNITSMKYWVKAIDT